MNIVLYVLDSLRADYLSAYGFPEDTSPFIDDLAERSLVFDNAYSQSTWTRSSGASLVSSTYPPLHGVETTDDVLPPDLPVLAEELRREGFTTAAITAMGNISPATGFDRGFDEYFELYKDESILESGDRLSVSESWWEEHFGSDTVGVATGEDINRTFESLLDRHADEDLFVLVWSLDTHDPYFHRDQELATFAPDYDGDPLWPHDVETPDEIRELRRIYLDMIRYADRQVEDLVSMLERHGQRSETMLVLTGDHGEAFGEHGEVGHGNAPYEEEIHVPLIVNLPGSEASGRTHRLVELNDIYPTVLSVAGAEPESEFVEGQPIIRDRKPVSDREYVFAQTDRGGLATKYQCVRGREFKYISRTAPPLSDASSVSDLVDALGLNLETIRTGRRTLYDMHVDGGEHRPISNPDVADQMERALRERIEQSRSKSSMVSETATAERDQAVEEQLKTLGYIE